MLASKNIRPAVKTYEMGIHWIGILAGELNVRLRDAREINSGLWPKTLVLGHRTGESEVKSLLCPSYMSSGGSRQPKDGILPFHSVC
jgi:DNA polymerase eta